MGKVGGSIVADKGDIRFEIVERIGVLERHENGWSRERMSLLFPTRDFRAIRDTSWQSVK